MKEVHALVRRIFPPSKAGKLSKRNIIDIFSEGDGTLGTIYK
jgi:hypothetical protein